MYGRAKAESSLLPVKTWQTEQLLYVSRNKHCVILSQKPCHFLPLFNSPKAVWYRLWLYRGFSLSLSLIYFGIFIVAAFTFWTGEAVQSLEWNVSIARFCKPTRLVEFICFFHIIPTFYITFKSNIVNITCIWPDSLIRRRGRERWWLDSVTDGCQAADHRWLPVSTYKTGYFSRDLGTFSSCALGTLSQNLIISNPNLTRQ